MHGIGEVKDFGPRHAGQVIADILEPLPRARPSVRAVELRRALARWRRAPNRRAALADGRGGITKANGFSLAD